MARDRKFTTAELFQATKQGLLQHGYEGFTFSLLAEQLDVSRGTIYKYYDNKDELITEFMLEEMNMFLHDLKKINDIKHFEDQFNQLFFIMFKNQDIHSLIEIGSHIQMSRNKKVSENKKRLDKLHLDMYDILSEFINNGKKEGILKPELPDNLLLGIIFQTIAIPNHSRVPTEEWVHSIKEIISHGMFKKDN